MAAKKIDGRTKAGRAKKTATTGRKTAKSAAPRTAKAATRKTTAKRGRKPKIAE